jgi:PIN domain nuclease of toxin-antitoxin system
LLDTCVLLWWLGGQRLPDEVSEAVENPDHDVVVSVGTLWEIAIKQATGKLKIDGDIRQNVREQFFRELPITGDHAAECGRLPLHHRDPFDRILVAQARTEGLTLITSDRVLSSYDVTIMPVRTGR